MVCQQSPPRSARSLYHNHQRSLRSGTVAIIFHPYGWHSPGERIASRGHRAQRGDRAPGRAALRASHSMRIWRKMRAIKKSATPRVGSDALIAVRARIHVYREGRKSVHGAYLCPANRHGCLSSPTSSSPTSPRPHNRGRVRATYRFGGYYATLRLVAASRSVTHT